MTKIKLKCENGHEDTAVVMFDLGPYAKDLAEILAGTSMLFRDAKRPRMIGLCCQQVPGQPGTGTVPCGASMTGEVVK